jgi:signal transduction histidine kinase
MRVVKMSERSYPGRVGTKRTPALTVMAVLRVASFVFAVVLATFPQLQFAYHGVLVRVALETAALLIALLAGFLVFGRLWRRGGLNDLLLACALAVFTLLNLYLLTMPALGQLLSQDLMVWVLLIGRSFGAILFALAAFAPRRRLRRPGVALAASVAGGSAAVLLTAAVLNRFAGPLANRLVAALAPASSEGPRLGGHPGLLTLQLATTVLYGGAAIGFLRRSRRFGDEFLGWLAISGVLAAFAHLNYSLYPLPYAQLVSPGDIFRLCFYAVLFAGSMREIWSYWQALSEAAVLEERQRIARDLHDGLAQELAYLARNLDSLNDSPDDSLGGERREETISLLAEAVQRAQLESRRVVSALAAPCAEPVEVALAMATAEVSERFNIGLQLDLTAGVKVSAAREDALVRIACEAVANAARHSGASQVELKLERDGSRLRLRVSDRGRGFDPIAANGGFGLISMRQRAHSVGGVLRISSAPGTGSEVEAAL